jgi:hypothetical protein
MRKKAETLRGFGLFVFLVARRATELGGSLLLVQLDVLVRPELGA